tara:strand:- start:756 stop:923 length:168 start_codon:yes stop_codon:yes gene_type:complete
MTHDEAFDNIAKSIAYLSPTMADNNGVLRFYGCTKRDRRGGVTFQKFRIVSPKTP